MILLLSYLLVVLILSISISSLNSFTYNRYHGKSTITYTIYKPSTYGRYTILSSLSYSKKLTSYYDRPSNPFEAFLAKLEEVIYAEDPTCQLLQLSFYDRKIKSIQVEQDPELQSISGRFVDLKAGRHLQLNYRSRTSELVKNVSLRDYEAAIREIFRSYAFCKATIKTVATIWELNLRGAGKLQAHPNQASPLVMNIPSLFPTSSLSTTSISSTTSPNTRPLSPSPPIFYAHDRVKASLIDSSEPFLQALKVVSIEGKPYMGMTDKLRQIQKFIEIMDSIISKCDAMTYHNHHTCRIVDMGCGSGYLTFAMHRYFHDKYDKLETIGIENRLSLVQKTQAITSSLGKSFRGLSFEVGSIDSYDSISRPMDVLVALHACDTATDDAIYRGIQANASIIIVAPCCHKEIRMQLDQVYDDNNSALYQQYDMMRHGIFRERQADMMTDAIRALVLQHAGYEVKVMEFIGGEHTAKNVMITAMKKRSSTGHEIDDRSRYEEKIRRLCHLYDIKHHILVDKVGLKFGSDVDESRSMNGSSKPLTRLASMKMKSKANTASDTDYDI